MSTSDNSAIPEAPAHDGPLAGDFPAATRDQWRELAEKALKGGDIGRLSSHTLDGIEIAPLYTRAEALAESSAARPGAAPFTRGSVDRVMAGGWWICERHVEDDAAHLAAAITEGLAGGTDVAIIELAGPGRIGLPADRDAVSRALAGLPRDRSRIALSGASASQVAALTDGLGVSIASLGVDPLGTLARNGDPSGLDAGGTRIALPPLPWPSSPATTLIADSRPYHEAGASEAQELAALASTLVAYLRAAEAAGLSPAVALPAIGLGMAVDDDVFLGIAKLRAARRIVWRIADACGAGDAAGRVTLSASTSERMTTRRDPHVNLLRATAACAAAAMGGADDITVLPYTWALGRPDAFARRIARNVGLVLREEAALGRIVDPAGGAWYVERLTDDLVRRGWELFQQWEAAGGMLAALRAGIVQNAIAKVVLQRDDDIAKGRIELTGTSAYPHLSEAPISVTPWPRPVAPPASTIRVLTPRRFARPFEHLRDQADACAVRPRVFLAAIGTPAESGARVTWMRNFLASGGIDVVAGDGFTASADAGLAFAGSGASVACICGSDAGYGELAEAMAMALKGAGASRVYVAGRPRALEAALSAAGVDGYIHAGVDRIEVLTRLLGEASGGKIAAARG